jgi:hypothetical protein
MRKGTADREESTCGEGNGTHHDSIGIIDVDVIENVFVFVFLFHCRVTRPHDKRVTTKVSCVRATRVFSAFGPLVLQ